MKRLGVVTISLCVALGVLCSAAVARGRMLAGEPDELENLGFGVCEGVPCFHGLIPDRTSWIDGRTAILKRFSGIVNTACVHFSSGDVQGDLCASDTDEKKLGNIFLWSKNGLLPFALLVREYGLPCLVYTYENTSDAIVTFRHLTAHLAKTTEHLEPDSKIVLMILHDPKIKDPCYLEKGVERGIGVDIWAWKGFTRYVSRKS